MTPNDLHDNALRIYAVSSDGIDAGRIIVAPDGAITVEVPPPHGMAITEALRELRTHGITDLGQAVLKDPVRVEGKELFLALWKRLLLMGFTLERID